ncbi:hypothetical protein BQ8482_480104 [Mesorhizobium delmotii]|uniref:Uncharacterized protein n=1 Tax=Mesorhizobium delmotii TaxID=1631247 RepID=A0A2P9AU19_9HYPH|nr:hypothetical protein BQ8482_480104 [Mesorhizobium delmotii]
MSLALAPLDTTMLIPRRATVTARTRFLAAGEAFLSLTQAAAPPASIGASTKGISQLSPSGVVGKFIFSVRHHRRLPPLRGRCSRCGALVSPRHFS